MLAAPPTHHRLLRRSRLAVSAVVLVSVPAAVWAGGGDEPRRIARHPHQAPPATGQARRGTANSSWLEGYGASTWRMRRGRHCFNSHSVPSTRASTIRTRGHANW